MKSKNFRSLVIKGALFTAATLAAPHFAQAETLTGEAEAECLGPEITEPLVAVFGKLVERTDGSVCKSEDPKGYRLVQVLSTIQHLKFNRANEASGDDIVTPRFGTDWISYIHEKTNAIRIGRFDCYEGIAGVAGGHEIHLCLTFFNPKETDLINAIETLMHEAAHLHNFVSHRKCRVAGDYQGTDMPACDDTMTDGGAYAVSVETKAKLATSVENISPVLKSAARSDAIFSAFVRINNPPNIKLKKRPLVLTGNGEIGFFENKKFLKIQDGLPKGILARGWADDYFYIQNAPNGSIVRFQNPRQISVKEKNTNRQLSALKMLKGDLSEIRGVHLGNNIQVVLAKKTIEVICRADKPRSTFENAPTHKFLEISRAENTSLVYIDGFDRASDTVWVRANAKTWISLKCDNDGNLSSVVDANNAYFASFRKIFQMGESLFGIDSKGRFGIFELDGKTSKIVPYLSKPIYDVIEMDDYVYFNDDGSASNENENDVPTTVINE